MTVTATIGSGGTHADMATWESDVESNSPLSEPYIGQLLNEEFTFTANALTIAGTTTTATNNITLTTATGAGFKDHADVRTNPLVYNASNGAAVRATSAGSYNLILVDDDNVVLRGLQLAMDFDGNSSRVIETGSGISNLLVDDCIIKGGSRGLSGQMGNNVKVFNTLFQARTVGAAVAISCIDLTMRSCTIVNWDDGIGDTEYAPVAELVNCAVFNNVDDFPSGVTYGTSTKNCATDNASAVPGGGANNQNGLTMSEEFESTTVDFRAKDGNLDGAGLADETNTPDDITDTDRADPPTVGCWEFVSAAIGVDEMQSAMQQFPDYHRLPEPVALPY